MQLSLKAGKRVTLEHVGIFADGVAVKQVGALNFQIAQQYVDEVMTVNTDQICAAIKSVFEDTRSIVEPAGALATAGMQQYALPKGAKVVTICSGANVTFERLQQIAERTLIGSGKEALFAVTMPEKPGALRTFCTDVVNGHSITEFNYRLNERAGAHILVGISIANEAGKEAFMAKMKKHEYQHVNLSTDDIGALGDFLAAVGTKWNISAFHYRGAASDTGNVLIGFEATDKKTLEAILNQTGCTWQSVDTNPSMKVFLK